MRGLEDYPMHMLLHHLCPADVANLRYAQGIQPVWKKPHELPWCSEEDALVYVCVSKHRGVLVYVRQERSVRRHTCILLPVLSQVCLQVVEGRRRLQPGTAHALGPLSRANCRRRWPLCSHQTPASAALKYVNYCFSLKCAAMTHIIWPGHMVP